VLGAVTAGKSSVVVRWSAPKSTGGSPITGYTVSAWSGSSLRKVTTVKATARTATLSGLANGTPVTITVRAANAAGNGPVSARSTKVTPRTTPGKPALGRVTTGKASLTVRWVAPTSNGGAAVTKYTVRTWSGSRLVKVTTVAGSKRSVTVTGLRAGTAYRVTVSATNQAGAGPASAKGPLVRPRA
jgi:hypothetical protein